MFNYVFVGIIIIELLWVFNVLFQKHNNTGLKKNRKNEKVENVKV